MGERIDSRLFRPGTLLAHIYRVVDRFARFPQLPPPTPLPGDVVVRSCADHPTDYALCPEPAPGQIRCTAYRTAVEIAKRWGRREHVDVWFADGIKSFALLSRHRLDEPRPTMPASGPNRIWFEPIETAPDVEFDHAGEQMRPPHPNALLIAGGAVAKELLTVFHPDFAPPIAEWDPNVSMVPPPIDRGTLVVWNVDRMHLPEQNRLDAFVQQHGDAVQILSVATREFFDRVRQGEFLASLYYRLNEVKVHIDE